MNARSSGVLLGDGFRLIDEELDLDDHHLLASKRCGWGASNFALELDAEPEQLDDRGHMLVGVGRCLADDNGEESTLHARLFACFVGAGGHSAILHDEVAASLGVKVVGDNAGGTALARRSAPRGSITCWPFTSSQTCSPFPASALT